MNRRGFTLIELLVVIGIIGILIAALVPAAKGAQQKAKERAVTTQAANIQLALNNYAQNHNGNFPGTAIDIMAPYQDHALGDNAPPTPLFTGTPANAFDAAPGRMVEGVLGGFGHYNVLNGTANVFEQIKNVKNTPIVGNTGEPRFFDNLIATDAIQEFPPNPFATTSTGERQRMRNIFKFQINIAGGFDPNNLFSPGESSPGNADYDCALYVQRNGTPGGAAVAVNDSFDTTRVFLRHNPLPGGVNVTTYPGNFAANCKFGTDEGDYFSPGDFAYIPVLSTSPYPFGDSTATLENEAYKWGTGVTGYMFFAYGAKDNKKRSFEAEAAEFVTTGLPGYGEPGVDTIYENYALQCFEGAVHYSKHGF